MVNDSAITASVGSGATGNISVTTPIGTATSGTNFTFIPAPTITSFSPSSGGSGTAVTISGTNLQNATSVIIGGIAATITADSATSMTVTVGSGATGVIVVSTPGGTATSGTNFSFTYQTPTITSIGNPYGSAGTQVQIQGANFEGATSVCFGGTPATSFTIMSDSEIIAILGSGSTGKITVTDPAGTGTSSNIFYCMPTITSFTPSSGGAGVSVSITGTNFLCATAVTFGGMESATFTVNSNTSITATVGSGTTGVISMTTLYGTETSTTDFTFIPAPTITSFSPSSGGTGTSVTISGANLANATSVTIGGIAATITADSATSISVTLGSGATGPIVVTTPGGTATSHGTFTYFPPPNITGFLPSNGCSGTVISITGTHFTGATSVTIGGTSSASFTVNSDNSISATVGGGSTGAVSVTTPGGTATFTSFGFYFFPLPTITNFTPSSGGTGTVISITGGKFTGTTAVTIGGTSAASFTVNSDTSISATVGSGATGPIVVTTPGGTATSATNFTFIPAPIITSFNSGAAFNNSAAEPGMLVTITGENFTGATAVTFGGIPAATFTENDDTTIFATVGSGATGYITVITPGGTATSTEIFTFYPPLTAVTLTADPDSSSYPPGDPITLTATPTGGMELQYMFWLYNPVGSPAWTQLQSYSSSNTCVWTPKSDGAYYIVVTAQDVYTGSQATDCWYYVEIPMSDLKRDSVSRVAAIAG